MNNVIRRIAVGAVSCASVVLAAPAHSQESLDRVQQLEQQVAELRGEMKRQAELIATLRVAVGDEVLSLQRGGMAEAVPGAVPATPAEPVGEAPKRETRAPEVAQIFAEPTVLTRSGDFVLEPSVQSAYWASDRVALVGYSIIPALLIGLIDVRRVKTTNMVAALTARYGVGKRFEFEVRAPYLKTSVDTVSREILTGSAQDSVFRAEGSGLGDVDATLRYQFNRGDYSKPFWIGWLRYLGVCVGPGGVLRRRELSAQFRT